MGVVGVLDVGPGVGEGGGVGVVAEDVAAHVELAVGADEGRVVVFDDEGVVVEGCAVVGGGGPGDGDAAGVGVEGADELVVGVGGHVGGAVEEAYNGVFGELQGACEGVEAWLEGDGFAAVEFEVDGLDAGGFDAPFEGGDDGLGGEEDGEKEEGEEEVSHGDPAAVKVLAVTL